CFFPHSIGHRQGRGCARNNSTLQLRSVTTTAMLLIRGESRLQWTAAASARRRRACLDIFETQDRNLIDADDEHEALLRIRSGGGPVRPPLIAWHRDGVDERWRREQAEVARLADPLSPRR